MTTYQDLRLLKFEINIEFRAPMSNERQENTLAALEAIQISDATFKHPVRSDLSSSELLHLPLVYASELDILMVMLETMLGHRICALQVLSTTMSRANDL